MNLVGKKVSLSVKFIFDNSVKTEYIQGVVKEENDYYYIIEQYIPFSYLFFKVGDFRVFERKVFKTEIRDSIIIED